MAVDIVSALKLIEKLSDKVPPSALIGLQGIYHWKLPSGFRLCTMEVTSIISWKERNTVQLPRATIIVTEAAFHALANKVDDPLTLFNTGKLAIMNSSSDTCVEVDVMKLMNFIFNNTLPPSPRTLELEALSVQGKDFFSCQSIENERYIEPFLRRGEPVIVKNACVTWPIFNMSVAQIVESAGHLDVSILLEEYDLESGSPPKYKKARFDEYVNGLYGGSTEVDGYMAANTVPPTMEATYGFPSSFNRESFNTPRWWIGPANTGLRLHRDMVDNFLVQLKGRKRIRLYSPSETKFLYPAVVGGNLMYEPSHVDPDRHLPEKFSAFQQAVHTVCELSPGDMLYLPAGWWHHVLNLEVSWSLNFFAVNDEPRVLSANHDVYESGQL